jgi:hypothetical protein
VYRVRPVNQSSTAVPTLYEAVKAMYRKPPKAAEREKPATLTLALDDDTASLPGL